MKRIPSLIFLSLSLLFLLSSCIWNKRDEAPEPYTPDLIFFDLTGPVRTLTDVTEGVQYTFDEQGRLLTVDGRDPFSEELLREYDETEGIMIEHPRFNRDTLGQIVQRLSMEGEINYQWSDRRVVAETGSEEGTEWRAQYEYDAQGQLVKHTLRMWNDGDDPDQGEVFTDEYTYTEIDSHGNWIVRSNGSGFEFRRITYYDTQEQPQKDSQL